MIELFAGPWGPLLIFIFRIVDVSLSTLRITTIVRGPRWMAPILGFVEILVWIFAAGAAIQNLSSWMHAVAYAGGFAAGTVVGMWAERRMAHGWGVVRAISRSSERLLATALREAGFAVTEQEARGKSGPVDMLYIVVRRRMVPSALQIIQEFDPDCFVTVQTDVAVRGGFYASGRRF
jgi:uncharacterized protein YebE (UPF0316 family)